MAIHSVLPNDLGLTLWSAWSAKDVEFAEEWEPAILVSSRGTVSSRAVPGWVR